MRTLQVESWTSERWSLPFWKMFFKNFIALCNSETQQNDRGYLWSVLKEHLFITIPASLWKFFRKTKWRCVECWTAGALSVCVLSFQIWLWNRLRCCDRSRHNYMENIGEGYINIKESLWFTFHRCDLVARSWMFVNPSGWYWWNLLIEERQVCKDSKLEVFPDFGSSRIGKTC